MYEVGFNHFFRGPDAPGGGDQLFVQGHASPGIYARAFLEGVLSEDQLDGFRQELSHPAGSLPSYPHPRLMPDVLAVPDGVDGPGPAATRSTRRGSTATCSTAGSRTPASSACGRSSATARHDEPESLGNIGAGARARAWTT